jgi:hypothetical protein
VPFVFQHYTHGFDSTQLWRSGRIRCTFEFWTYSVAATFCLFTYLNTAFVIHYQTSVLTRASASVLGFSPWQASQSWLDPPFLLLLILACTIYSSAGFCLSELRCERKSTINYRADERKIPYRVMRMRMNMIGRYSTSNSIRVDYPQRR